MAKLLVIVCVFLGPAIVVGVANTMDSPIAVEPPGSMEKPYPGGKPVTDPVVVLDTIANIEGVTTYPPP